ncbi:hypothetical protein Tco_0313590 [Tanacetum coccineum]
MESGGFRKQEGDDEERFAKENNLSLYVQVIEPKTSVENFEIGAAVEGDRGWDMDVCKMVLARECGGGEKKISSPYWSFFAMKDLLSFHPTSLHGSTPSRCVCVREILAKSQEGDVSFCLYKNGILISFKEIQG